MTKNRKIKTLEKQNASLYKENRELRTRIPSQEYANKMDRSLDRFESINDNLMLLYQEQYRNQRRRRHIYRKYQLAILWIRLKQWCTLELRLHR